MGNNKFAQIKSQKMKLQKHQQAKVVARYKKSSQGSSLSAAREYLEKDAAKFTLKENQDKGSTLHLHGSLSQMSQEFSSREKQILNEGEDQEVHEVTSLEMLEKPEGNRPFTVDLDPTKNEKFDL